jgi:hypothetical protein
VELQAIRYAALVSTLTFERAVGILGAHLEKQGVADVLRPVTVLMQKGSAAFGTLLRLANPSWADTGGGWL